MNLKLFSDIINTVSTREDLNVAKYLNNIYFFHSTCSGLTNPKQLQADESYIFVVKLFCHNILCQHISRGTKSPLIFAKLQKTLKSAQSGMGEEDNYFFATSTDSGAAPVGPCVKAKDPRGKSNYA